jgi:hypothetical protein
MQSTTANGRQKRSNSVSAVECREFLIAMVNDRPGSMAQYRGYLPNLVTPIDGECLRHFYNRLLPLSGHEEVPIPMLRLCGDEMYVALLRYQLRVIWERARNKRTPRIAASRLCDDIRALQHLRHDMSETEPHPDDSSWCIQTGRALNWLEQNIHKLMKCALKECRQFPYFIRDKPHQKYCSGICSAEAEQVRASNRPPENTHKTNRLSEQGRAKIVDAQKKRWAEFRKQKAQVRGVKGGKRS